MYLGFALFLLLVFIVAAMLAFGVFEFLLRLRVESRLELIRANANETFLTQPSTLELRARGILESLNKLSAPKSDETVNPIKQKFIMAGYRGDFPILVYYAFKTILSICLPILFLIVEFVSSSTTSLTTIAFYTLGLVAIGYYGPDLYLKHLIKVRQREIFETFPDALDLMRVCVGAGLGLDAAIARVGKELEANHSALGEEFRELSLQLRAGIARNEALNNLAVRTGVDDVNALVTMLIQSERFGTNVSESLKIHADALRNKRRMQAQEAGSKVPAKLSIPMMLCIFPVLYIVILGPAMIAIYRTFGH